MVFASPWALLALVVLIPLGLRVARSRGRRSGAVPFSDLSELLREPRPWRASLAGGLPWVRLGALGLLIVGLARPQTVADLATESTEGIDIMLTLDISGSMLGEDFEPRNRLTAARQILSRFARETRNDRLGLVVFASQAFTQCPLTLDHETVAKLIDQVEYGIIPDGTAVGMAIALAAHRLQGSQAKSRVVILLTDGVNNRGKVDPLTAARAAAAIGVRVYAVGVGSPGGGKVPITAPNRGTVYMDAPLDEETLQEVAKATGGQYYRAGDAASMDSIYREIRSMEKTRFVEQRRRPMQERCGLLLWPGLVLLVGALVLGQTVARKAP
jgi:Ca-activated chloride channel family protein